MDAYEKLLQQFSVSYIWALGPKLGVKLYLLQYIFVMACTTIRLMTMRLIWIHLELSQQCISGHEIPDRDDSEQGNQIT